MDAYVEFVRAVVRDQSEIADFMRERYYEDLVKSKLVFDQPRYWQSRLEEAIDGLLIGRVDVEGPIEEDSEVVRLLAKYLAAVRMLFVIVVREYYRSSRACVAWEIHELLRAESEYSIKYITGQYPKS